MIGSGFPVSVRTDAGISDQKRTTARQGGSSSGHTLCMGRPGLIPTYHQFCLYLKIILSYISISFNYFLKSNTKWVSTWSPRYPALWLMGQAYRDSFFPCSAVGSKVSNGRFGGCGSREELRALSISSIQDTCFWVDFTTLLHIHTWHVFLGGLHQN